MRIEQHPRLRRILAILGLVLILGLLAGFLLVLLAGGSPMLALALFGCLVMASVVMYLFIGYVRRYEDSGSQTL